MQGSDTPRFFSPAAETTIGHNRLPHWDQQGRTYFVTFRLADSVPIKLLRKHAEEETQWRSLHPEPWTHELELEFHRRFSGRIERWLDQGHGACILRNPDCAQIVADALAHFEGDRCLLHAWVVMPNHIHALFELLRKHQLPALIKSWKGFTARQINEHLDRTGTLWQKSYYDRLIRDWDHFGNSVRYIRRNPSKAHLKPGTFLHGENELAGRF